MSHCNTIFAQILKIVPRHEFETLAIKHNSGRSFSTATRWSQFVSLSLAQLSGRNGLRDIVENISGQVYRLYHLGSAKLSASNLSSINRNKSYELYEALFRKLSQRCQRMSPNHKFRFNNPLYSLDASTIDLCLSVFPWAEYKTTKGAIKLHVGLNHGGRIPEFAAITDGKRGGGVTATKTMNFPEGSIVAIDRGYNDYAWYKQLTDKGIFFVTRLKSNAKTRVVERHDVLKNKGLTSNQTIEFTGKRTAKKCSVELRRIGYRDPVTGKLYIFLTNTLTWQQRPLLIFIRHVGMLNYTSNGSSRI